MEKEWIITLLSMRVLDIGHECIIQIKNGNIATSRGIVVDLLNGLFEEEVVQTRHHICAIVAFFIG